MRSKYYQGICRATIYSACIASVALGTAAYAQSVNTDASDGSSEIVVSGQRQQYVGNVPARDVPQNIQTLDSSMLKAAGITRLETALDLVSGTSRQNNFGGLWDA